jgi:hypothetical protein
MSVLGEEDRLNFLCDYYAETCIFHPDSKPTFIPVTIYGLLSTLLVVLPTIIGTWGAQGEINAWVN